MNILFVCTGNICRSPAAEYLLRDKIRHTQGVAPEITVSSAGTMGMSGYGMDDRSLRWLDAHGIDGTGFVARRVNKRLLKSADLVIGLEQEHVDACLRTAPAVMNRTFRLHQLAEWSRNGDLSSLDDLPGTRARLPQVIGDHDDPVGLSSTADYDRIVDAIAEDVAAVAALLPEGAPQ